MEHICSIDLLVQLFTNRVTFLVQNTYETRVRESLSKCIQPRPPKQQHEIVALDSSAVQDIQTQLLLKKTTEATSFFLFGGWTFNAEILRIANQLSMLSTSYMWFVSQCDIPESSHFEFIPINSVALKKTHFSGRELDKSVKLCIEREFEKSNTIHDKDISDEEIHTNSSRVFVVNALNEDKEWQPIASISLNNVTLYSDSLHLLSRFRSPQMFMKLKVVTIVDPPFTYIHESDDIYDSVYKTCHVGKLCWKYENNGNNVTESHILVPRCCVGLCIDLLNLMERDLSFMSDVYIVQDSTYGASVNGSWVGMVGDLLRGEADMVAAALTISETRTQVISFTDPYMIGGATLVTFLKKSQLSFLNMEFLKPLSFLLWLTTAVAMVVTSVVLKFAERFGVAPREYAMRQTLLYVNGLVFQRNIGGEEPINFASRFNALMFAVGMMVVMSTYTAVLTANKVTHKTELPLTGFKDEKVRITRGLSSV